MGGRGASSGGKNGKTPKGYRRVDSIDGVHVIRNIRTGKGLPRQSSIPRAKYFGTNSSGKITQMRLYDGYKNAKMDIDWGHAFEGNPIGTVHAHTWGNGIRSTTHRMLTPTEIQKYKPIIKKATKRFDLLWQKH